MGHYVMYTETTEKRDGDRRLKREDMKMNEEIITTSTGMQNLTELLYLAALLLGGLLTALL